MTTSETGETVSKIGGHLPYLQGTQVGIIVLEKLKSDTCFFLSAQIGFLGMKTTSKNWGTN